MGTLSPERELELTLAMEARLHVEWQALRAATGGGAKRVTEATKAGLAKVQAKLEEAEVAVSQASDAGA